MADSELTKSIAEDGVPEPEVIKAAGGGWISGDGRDSATTDGTRTGGGKKPSVLSQKVLLRVALASSVIVLLLLLLTAVPSVLQKPAAGGELYESLVRAENVVRAQMAGEGTGDSSEMAAIVSDLKNILARREFAQKVEESTLETANMLSQLDGLPAFGLAQRRNAAHILNGIRQIKPPSEYAGKDAKTLAAAFAVWGGELRAKREGRVVSWPALMNARAIISQTLSRAPSQKNLAMFSGVHKGVKNSMRNLIVNAINNSALIATVDNVMARVRSIKDTLATSRSITSPEPSFKSLSGLLIAAIFFVIVSLATLLGSALLRKKDTRSLPDINGEVKKYAAGIQPQLNKLSVGQVTTHVDPNGEMFVPVSNAINNAMYSLRQRLQSTYGLTEEMRSSVHRTRRSASRLSEMAGSLAVAKAAHRSEMEKLATLSSTSTEKVGSIKYNMVSAGEIANTIGSLENECNRIISSIASEIERGRTQSDQVAANMSKIEGGVSIVSDNAEQLDVLAVKAMVQNRKPAYNESSMQTAASAISKLSKSSFQESATLIPMLSSVISTSSQVSDVLLSVNSLTDQLQEKVVEVEAARKELKHFIESLMENAHSLTEALDSMGDIMDESRKESGAAIGAEPMSYEGCMETSVLVTNAINEADDCCTKLEETVGGLLK